MLSIEQRNTKLRRNKKELANHWILDSMSNTNFNHWMFNTLRQIEYAFLEYRFHKKMIRI